MIPENYFDLWQVFVNEVVGSPTLFIIVGIIILVYVSLKLGFTFEAITMIVVVFVVITLSQLLGGSYLMFYGMIGLLIAGFFGIMFNKKLFG